MEINKIVILGNKIIHGLLIAIIGLVLLSWMFYGTAYSQDKCEFSKNYENSGNWIGFVIALAILAIWAYLIFSQFSWIKVICAYLILIGFLVYSISLSATPSMSMIHSPGGTIKDMLRDLEFQGGYGMSIAKRVTFSGSTGCAVTLSEIVNNLPNINAGDIKIYCMGNICSPQGPIETPGNVAIKSSKPITVYIVACANSEKALPPNYCVAVSEMPFLADEECSLRCDLK